MIIVINQMCNKKKKSQDNEDSLNEQQLLQRHYMQYNKNWRMGEQTS